MYFSARINTLVSYCKYLHIINNIRENVIYTLNAGI